MGDFSLEGGLQKYEDFGVVLATTLGTIVTDGGVANTKGSFVEMIASTGFDYDSFKINVRATDNFGYIFDIAIGAAGSEVILVPDVLVAWTSGVTTRVLATMEIPMSIPAGTRISCRVQSSSTSRLIIISGIGESNTFKQESGLSKCVSYGALTATSKGTLIDPGTTIHTKGSWVELTSASTGNIKKLILSIDGNRNNLISLNSFLFDIAIGADGSEEVIIPNFFVYTDSGNDSVAPGLTTFDVDIPDGTRIAVRSQCSTNDATDRLLNVSLLGVV